MSTAYEIPKSKNYRRLRQGLIIGFSVTVFVLTFLVLRGAHLIFGIEATVLGWMIRIGITLLAIGAIILSSKRSGARYTLDGSRLIATKYWMGVQRSQEIITLDHTMIHTIRLQQTILDKLLDAGTISIEVDGNSSRTLKLERIETPEAVMQRLLALQA